MSDENNIDILGAGPAGLCAAINLAKAGKKVTVHEIRQDVGMRFHPNYQGFGESGRSVEEYVKKFNINAKFGYKLFSKVIICSRNFKREMRLSGRPFVERGGKNSLEYGMYKEAVRLGVEFEFSTKRTENDVKIVATGPKRCDAAAFGMEFENTSFPRDTLFIMFNDRYSPKGWYCYIIPVSKDRIEFVNCVSQPHVPLLKELTFKAMKENRIVNDIIGGKRPVASFGGIGGFDCPTTAIRNGRLYVGEAAGFQDFMMGFGIEFAMRSGQCAAESIVNGRDYDRLWKESFLDEMKTQIGYRFLTSAFGDAAPEMIIKGLKDGDLLERPDTVLANKTVNKILFRLETAKRSVTGHW